MAVYEKYDFNSRFAKIENNHIHYVDQGEGETLLMVHGNPTWSYLYRHQIAALSSDYRCIALDHLGYGFSDKPSYGDYSIRAHIRRLGQFINSLNLKHITLVVHDWGGIIGLNWAVRHKELIDRLVIMNTTAFPTKDPDIKKKRPTLLRLVRLPVVGEIFVQGFNGFTRYLLPKAVYHRQRLTPQVMEAYTDPYPTWSSRRAHLETVRQIPISQDHPTHQILEETERDLDAWTVPTQLIWGMNDPIFFPSFLEEFERRLPNHSPSIKIDKAGHFLQEDAPEIINNSIRSFIQNHNSNLVDQDDYNTSSEASERI